MTYAFSTFGLDPITIQADTEGVLTKIIGVKKNCPNDRVFTVLSGIPSILLQIT